MLGSNRFHVLDADDFTDRAALNELPDRAVLRRIAKDMTHGHNPLMAPNCGEYVLALRKAGRHRLFEEHVVPHLERA